MKTKDLLEITGCSRSTLIRTTARLFPGLTQKGKATVYTESQSIALIKALPKANVVQMAQGPEPNGTGSEGRIERLEKMVEHLCVSIASLIPSQAATRPAQLEAPSHYSIMGFAAMRHRPIDFTDARKLACQARGICAERGLEVHKVGDERYGVVNSYPVAVLEEVFA